MEFGRLFTNIFPIPDYTLYNIVRHDMLNEIDKEVEEFLKKKGTVGLAFGINNINSQVFKKGYGFQDRENQIKITTDNSLFRWASMSKMITSILSLKLHEERKLDLDSTIEDHLQNYKKPNRIVKKCISTNLMYKKENTFTYLPCINGFVEYDIEPTDHIVQSITPWLLLSNRSGICSYENENTPYKSSPTYAEMKNAKLYTKEFHHFLDYFLDKPLVSLPGEEYNYSTFGFNLMGRILELSSGVKYMDLVNVYIKDNDTILKSLIPDKEVDKHLYPNRCKGYQKGKLTEDTDVSFKLPGGGFMSNLEDALDFCMKVTKLSTYEKLLAWSKTDELSSYGMGFMVWEHDHDHFSVGHLGSQQKAITFLQYYPKHKICLVGLSNDENFPQKEFRELLHKNIIKL